MVLNFPGDDGEEYKSIFPHNRRYNEGINEKGIRAGQATVVVALDGSGDAETLTEGVNLLPTNGGTIFVKEGTYPMKILTISGFDNVSIEGVGFASHLKLEDSQNTKLLDIENCDNFTIRNIQLDGNKANQSSGNSNVLTIDSDGGTAKDFFVGHCYLHDGRGAGITAANTANGIITNCFSYNNAGTGIEGGGSGRMTISNNESYSNTSRGIKLDVDDNCIISGNACYSNTSNGIETGNNADKNTISDNQCFSNAAGIVIGADRNIVTGNTALGNSGAQITDNGTNTQIGHNITI
ncbi:hypothetical protein CMI41_04845 [Candidatus Pacearchaeota archaeon]|nr:hypothetical protein [Candidatus Pacearchaeota archaeon]|tara:strand:- start:1389 stop:2273 length:885 start_codon:yes stop_codon:yes gene_type:complete